MNSVVLTASVLGAMTFLLCSGVWIGISLLLTGLVALVFFTPAPAGSLMAQTVWDSSWDWALTALPLFIWMGEILFRSRLSEDMFKGLAPWVSWLPGKLLHVNVVGCAVMAAITGSTAVCSATVGRMTVPELKKRGYDDTMAYGTLAASGTLGILMPPSIQMMVYGVVAQVSIGQLFIAGVLPAIMVMLMYMAYVAGWALLHPDRMPVDEIRMSLLERIWASRRLIPAILLIFVVLGSIYGGVATPTEAAAIGVVGAFGLAAFTGTLNVRMVEQSLFGAVKTSCMIGLILAGGAFLSIAMGFTGLPKVMAGWVDSLHLGRFGLIILLTIVYIILGTALDGISMVLLTSPVVFPMAQAAGIDLLWFGIYIVLVAEMAQISPPVGFNLFVVQSLAGADLWTVSRACLPFFFMLIAAIALIAVFPQIVSFLPNLMSNVPR